MLGRGWPIWSGVNIGSRLGVRPHADSQQRHRRAVGFPVPFHFRAARCVGTVNPPAIAVMREIGDGPNAANDVGRTVTS